MVDNDITISPFVNIHTDGQLEPFNEWGMSGIEIMNWNEITVAFAPTFDSSIPAAKYTKANNNPKRRFIIIDNLLYRYLDKDSEK